eukprot:GHVU01108243.1.p3 GENE.GHVU01108243.1~~GHVU01108243.1.p3  ORF type:complete len:222 (+),score=39.19 GHVU01108243.1:1456-2121(+)
MASSVSPWQQQATGTAVQTGPAEAGVEGAAIAAHVPVAERIAAAAAEGSEGTTGAAKPLTPIDAVGQEAAPASGSTSSPYINATFTDYYQLTMAYTYWQFGKHNQHATFEAFIRKCPFQGEFAILAGVEELIRFIHSFRFTDADIAYIRSVLPTAHPDFFTYLTTIRGDCLTLDTLPEGSVFFPRVPVAVVSGPLAVCQLVETALLNLLSFPSLVATNAAR